MRVLAQLKQIIAYAVKPEDVSFRCRAMEAVSFIGMHVPRELFIKDAKEIMDLFSHVMASSHARYKPDDAALQYVMQSWCVDCVRRCWRSRDGCSPSGWPAGRECAPR
jgi:hypothetical protein